MITRVIYGLYGPQRLWVIYVREDKYSNVRLWLHSLYGLYGPRCPLSLKRLINLISLSLVPCLVTGLWISTVIGFCVEMGWMLWNDNNWIADEQQRELFNDLVKEETGTLTINYVHLLLELKLFIPFEWVILGNLFSGANWSCTVNIK